MTQQQYITIPLHKGCVLVLTPDEWARGIGRGKAQRRREAHERRRQQGDGSLDEVLSAKGENNDD